MCRQQEWPWWRAPIHKNTCGRELPWSVRLDQGWGSCRDCTARCHTSCNSSLEPLHSCDAVLGLVTTEPTNWNFRPGEGLPCFVATDTRHRVTLRGHSRVTGCTEIFAEFDGAEDRTAKNALSLGSVSGVDEEEVLEEPTEVTSLGQLGSSIELQMTVFTNLFVGHLPSVAPEGMGTGFISIGV